MKAAVTLPLVYLLIACGYVSSLDDVNSSGEQHLIPPAVSRLDSAASTSPGLFDDADSPRTPETNKPGWRKTTECKSDLNCVNLNSICLNGNCVRICTAKPTNDSDCLYFHCDSKRVIEFQPPNNPEFSIETNNYPLLSRYLSKKKCAWVLNHAGPSQHRFIQLRFDRFATQLANDYLYIFAGDSVYSPLIAALRYRL